MPDELLFKKVPVKVQKRSGYDKSNHNMFTGYVGMLIPMFCEEVIPNHTISTKIALSTQLPPLATDTFMRLQQKVEAFFVPTRLLMKDYDKWITRNHQIPFGTNSTASIAPPAIQIPYTNFTPGSLIDYLGGMVSKAGIDACRESGANPSYVTLSAFPFLAYNLIWDEWYRNSLIQKSCFYNEAEVALNASNLSAMRSYKLSKMKVITPTDSLGYIDTGSVIGGVAQFPGADNVDMLDLRFRNFGLDYFTSATSSPQNGPASAISIDTSGATGSLSISAIRSANSIQQFEERQNLAGNRLVDFVKAQYGANLSDMIAQRPVLLGSASFDVYSKGVYQTANGTGSSQNPWDSTVGARFGSAYAEGTDFIIKDFTANEPGYIMIITSLVPRVTYSSGLKRYLRHYIGPNTQGDMANPTF